MRLAQSSWGEGTGSVWEKRCWTSRTGDPTRPVRLDRVGSASENRVRRSMVIALLWLLPTAAVADGLHPPPTTEDFLVEWYQPFDIAADGEWEIEVRPFREGAPITIERADAASIDSCWALEVPTSSAALVRIRKAGSAAEWSGYTTVPEPSSVGAMGAALLLAAVEAAHRRRGSRRAECRGRNLGVKPGRRESLHRDPEAQS